MFFYFCYVCLGTSDQLHGDSCLVSLNGRPRTEAASCPYVLKPSKVPSILQASRSKDFDNSQSSNCNSSCLGYWKLLPIPPRPKHETPNLGQATLTQFPTSNPGPSTLSLYRACPALRGWRGVGWFPLRCGGHAGLAGGKPKGEGSLGLGSLVGCSVTSM